MVPDQRFSAVACLSAAFLTDPELNRCVLDVNIVTRCGKPGQRFFAVLRDKPTDHLNFLVLSV